MSTAIENAAQSLSQLSDAEWMQLKSAEERRRADQRIIRDLSREFRDQKTEPAR